MNIKQLPYIILGLCSLTTVSCNKILEQEPKNSTYNEVFWSDPRAGTNAIAGNYSMLRDALADGLYNTWNCFYAYGDATTDYEFNLRTNDGQGNTEVTQGKFEHGYVAQSLGNWTKFYKTIAMSNIVLKNIAAVPEEVLKGYADPVNYRNNIKGQALFIRALTYFMLVRVWGDVPLVTEAYDDPLTAPHLPRTPKLEVMAQIEKDCKAAIENLKWEYNSAADRAVTANRGAANALLAHLYLWRATVSNVQTNDPIMADVDNAANAINEIETKGSYKLTDTANYYQTFIGRSTESIFELNKSENTLEGSTQHIGRWFLDSRYVRYFSANAFYYVKKDFLTSHFYKTTKVWEWVWVTNQWVWMEVEKKGMDNSDIRFRKNFDDVASDYPTCIKYSNIIFREPGQQLDGNFSNNQNIFRLADMQLLKAEIALYRNQVSTAIDIINGFRQRNGAHVSSFVPQTATKAQVMTEYIAERAKELYLEGQLFYDLVRTRQAVNSSPWLSDQRLKAEGFYWPVSPLLFRENKYLVQTQFWRGKI